MKAAVIFYHKNVHTIYPKRWIDKCISSIAAQTHKKYDVVELNYGDIFTDWNQPNTPPGSLVHIKGKKTQYFNIPMENHIAAMNFLLDHCFVNMKYDVVFNINMDDYYHPERFAKQIAKIQEGYDLVSSDFCYVEERSKPIEKTQQIELPVIPEVLEVADIKFNDPSIVAVHDGISITINPNMPTSDSITGTGKINPYSSYAPYLRENEAIFPHEVEYPTIDHQSTQNSLTTNNEQPTTEFEYTDEVTHHLRICSHGSVESNLAKNHNVIAHPCVAYNKTFWDGTLKYKNLLGYEDLDLWQRAIAAGKKLFIIDEELLFYRRHNNQVVQTHKGI